MSDFYLIFAVNILPQLLERGLTIDEIATIYERVSQSSIQKRSSTILGHKRNVYEKEEECLVCLEPKSEFYDFSNCSHSVCSTCTYKIISGTCPFCRAIITQEETVTLETFVGLAMRGEL